MYRIKDDKRVRTSARLIYTGLMRCLGSQRLSSLTVTDVLRSSGVGRATFYRIFDSLTDVLAYGCEQAFNEAISQSRQASTTYDALVAFTSVWLRESDLLEAVVREGRVGILIEAHAARADELGLLRRRTATRGDEVEHETDEFAVAMLSATMATTLVTWVRRGRRDSPTELVDRMRNGLTAMTHIFR